MKRLWMLIVLQLCVLFFAGCQSKSGSQTQIFETTEETTSRYEVPTPENELAIVLGEIKDEMRIFDVQAHHESLYALILSLEKEKGSTIEKSEIYSIVETYMDDYFWQLTHDLLSAYNENYALEEVEIIFEQTSRNGLYDLITLYEWTFYNKK